MNTEFATQKDVFDYINKHKLKLIVFDDKYVYWRTAFLVFEDKTYMRLLLEDCYTSKFFGCKYYEGKIKVDNLNGIKCNYEITLTDVSFKNNLIDGIEAEEKRLENRASEVFTNGVRNTDNGVYDYVTKVGDVFFHYHYNCGSIKYHTFNPNDYKIIPIV